ncbi:MAG: lamin tail domain-containing protein [Patescibacteria group bacterium]
MKKVIIKKVVLLFLILLPKISLAQDLPIIINQVLIGQNEGVKNEFIELYNPNDLPLNLEGYSLKKKTASGTESSLISNKNFLGIIPAKGFFLISSSEFKEIKADLNYSSTASLSINNSLLLYNQNKEVLDKIGWGDSSDFYQKPLANPKNNEVIKRTKFNYNKPNNTEDFIITSDLIEIRNSKNEIITIKNYLENTDNIKKENTKKENNIYKLKISEIKKAKNGAKTETEGMVINLPGEFGSQYFYILEEAENQKNYLECIQIYNYYKKFPDLKIGDKIKITGELSINDSGIKIKTKEAQDIIILSSNNDWPEMKETPISSLNELPNDSLVKIKGEINQNRANMVYIDDGEKEIIIEIKKGTKINKKTLEEGNFYTIEGLLVKKENEIEILPLSEKSIKNLNQVDKESIGEIIKENPLVLKSEKRTKEKIIIKYFLITTGGIVFYFLLEKKIKKFLK